MDGLELLGTMCPEWAFLHQLLSIQTRLRPSPILPSASWPWGAGSGQPASRNNRTTTAMKEYAEDTFTRTVKNLCLEVDILRSNLQAAEEEVDYWKNKHDQLVNDSIKHSQVMMGNLLVATLKHATKETP